MSEIYASVDEKAIHLKAIKTLAAETGLGVAAVQRVYEEELVALNNGANVREFLLVLTLRRAKTRLRKHPVPAAADRFAA